MSSTLDYANNFGKTTITGIASGVTSVVLDDATNFGDPASAGEYNCVIWEISAYGNPTDDPSKEIVRVTAKTGSTLTITRAQESTSDNDHNTGGSTYAIVNAITAKMITDIENSLDGKVIAPASNTADYIPQWNGANSKTLKDGLALSTNTSLGTSDTTLSSQNAIKTYVDNMVSGLLDYRGAYDASVNTYPASGGSGTAGAVLKGDMWIISVAGTLGGTAVQIGDSVIANVDTPAQTASNWNILNANISYVPEDVANKVTSISGASTDTQYPSAKLTYDQLALKAPLSGPTFTGTVTLPKTLEIQDTSADHQYVLAVSELTADRTITLPLLTGTDTFVFEAHTQTLTNKRITKRVASTTDDATAVIDSDAYDEYYLTAVANATEISVTGTPTTGQTIFIGLKDAGVAKALTWTGITGLGITLPTTTVAGKQHIIEIKYIASAWRGIAVNVEA